MKKVTFFTIKYIAMGFWFRTLYFLLCFTIIACGCTSNEVDTKKLNTNYFVGKYQTNYRNEIEKINLKENGYYDYAYGNNNDTFIRNAGKWIFHNYSPTYQSIEITDFPLLRKNKIYETNNAKINLTLDVNTSVSYLGDLYDIIGEDEDLYLFVKLDKTINKNYLKK